ncbi:hypothetical protein JRO89_XS13G0057300 [Xanthoceras sorbifolium]|uniref:WAT1-related protein n=1 Tax=Xanthoceras sorbifolium TaxID=99658 RepID=A0ABQ8H6V3_9ROSI|nr:hypothetical protein JRO89_XS13G0057300 [Xanthoceras sorbifolium]
MVSLKRAEMIEDVAIIGGLICMQFVYAGNSILMSYLMSLGLNPLTIIIFSTLATFIVLSPIAFCVERLLLLLLLFSWNDLRSSINGTKLITNCFCSCCRKQWPEKFSLKLIIQLLLLSFGGVTLFQTLFLKGIKITSPAMATAMPNLAPGLIFVIAWTVSTASAREAPIMSVPPAAIFDTEKIIGSMYLLAAVFVLSCNVVLQATTLRDFPAPISLCAITSFIGVFITAIVELLQDHKLEFGWPLVSPANMVCYSLLLGTISGACVSFNGWAMKKRGPVLVSMFSPIATVISVILLAGMFLMFTGLYFVLWAKMKEDYSGDFESEFDAEKPLLS